MPRKLFIYDETGFEDRWQAHGRFSSDDDDVVTLPVDSKQDAVDGLDKLLSQGIVFDRMLIQSHGDHGLIWLGKNQILSSDWESSFGFGGPANPDPAHGAKERVSPRLAIPSLKGGQRLMAKKQV